jgi:LmbE family N-acetylglucosaminyl deacetylase
VKIMATMVTFHAHPDDESIACGGVMRKAFEDGHRVILVVATRGERGEIPSFLPAGEELWEFRVRETHAAAEILGASRVEFLGYTDSGMMGDETNTLPGTFWSASVEEAAQKLADILIEENADVLTIYDANGTYGHPDHIQVHRVGKRAGEIAAAVDVSAFLKHKRQAMRAHASQITEESWFLSISEEKFQVTFGIEWFVRDGQGPGITETDLMAGTQSGA